MSSGSELASELRELLSRVEIKDHLAEDPRKGFHPHSDPDALSLLKAGKLLLLGRRKIREIIRALERE